ncbi:hypothetical protein KGF56_003736 [Candida oxycetoniae]|uniref:Ribosome quality control complex subunit 1 n=1 Tax=Candida oxycetoniae TaxID=497107 RepID=A0AAI9SV15_9ASCO|nr:uncharacterized protein KGF56_003736 [Candida oxycetoniae]KAI3403452.2 hypothetical protein KGF56_003736 [Candida oxycetoniae]
MSTRALRKLGGQSLEDELKKLELNRASERKTGEEAKKQFSKSNAFAFLNEDEDSGEGEDSGEDETNKEKEYKAKSKPEKPVFASTSGKSKKKKKKTRAKQVSQLESSKNKDCEEEKANEDEDDLDKILAEIKQKEEKLQQKQKSTNISLETYNFEDEYNELNDPLTYSDSNFKNFTTERLNKCLPLLSFKSIKNLDPDQEYKNLFGNSLSIELIEDANSTTSLAISPEVLQQFKKMAKMIRNWGGKDRRGIPGTSRKLLLSKIRDDWLPTQLKSVTMEEINDDDILRLFLYKEEDLEEQDFVPKLCNEKKLGVRYFKFNKVNDMKNRAANTKFYASTVLTPDPQSLMQLLQLNPYHQETLLQVAMVLLRQGDNKATSNALIERALFTFDRSFHKNFHELMSSAENGLIRLPFEFFSNRQFYLNIFRYIVSLGERSLFSTALSYCKFLLSCSPCEDPMGVRYFIDFYCIMSEEYEYLMQLKQSPLVTCYTRWCTPGISFSTALACLKLGKLDQAERELQKAAEAHPFVAYRLLTEICLSGTVSNIKESSFEASCETLVSAETYLIRAKVLWQSHLDFLNEHLRSFFNKYSKPSSKFGFAKSLMGVFTNDTSLSKEVPLNLIRFAILSGENKIMGKLPSTIWDRDDILEYDVLPPKEQQPAESVVDAFSKSKTKICDSLLDYVDENLLSAIVQQNTRGVEDTLSEEEINLLINRLQQANGEINQGDAV